MKWKIFSLFTALVLTLMACQAGDETGRGMNNNQNIDPVRNQTGEGMMEHRNMTMERDAERHQNRGNMNNRQGGTDDRTNYDIADEAAERITDEVDEIDRAYVITTNNNAYVAATLDTDNNNTNDGNRDRHHNRNSDELTEEVEEEIAEIVRSVNRNVNNVFVSTNPDFLNLVNEYTRDANRGEPVEGFFDQMGTMIERLFPQNR